MKTAYPDVDLKVDYFLGGSTDDFKQKAVTQMASGLFPDVIYFQNSQDWVYKGIIAPLDDYIDSDPEVDWNDVLEVAQIVATWQGKRYQLPTGVNAWALYYNKEYLQENGLKMPEDYLAEDRWTWDDGFLELPRPQPRAKAPPSSMASTLIPKATGVMTSWPKSSCPMAAPSSARIPGAPPLTNRMPLSRCNICLI